MFHSETSETPVSAPTLNARIAVGILTRNRAPYLDATLRSLSATDVPIDLSVTVFDDASDDPDSRRYLTTDDDFLLVAPLRWPSSKVWLDRGLGFLPTVERVRGVASRISVRRSEKPQGVVNASNWATRELFEANPKAPYVCLLQDDLVFATDWYQRLAEACEAELLGDEPSLVSGCCISYIGERRLPRTDRVEFTSAQCMAIPRAGWEALPFFREFSAARQQYDEAVSRAFRERGDGIRLLRPGCVQHIGFRSQVRPEDGEDVFLSGVGRFCHYSEGPYAWSDEVSDFSSHADLRQVSR